MTGVKRGKILQRASFSNHSCAGGARKLCIEFAFWQHMRPIGRDDRLTGRVYGADHAVTAIKIGQDMNIVKAACG